MITIKELREITKKGWGKMNPAQKLAILKKVYKISPTENNKKNLHSAMVAYKKWIATTSYTKNMKAIIKGVVYE